MSDGLLQALQDAVNSFMWRGPGSVDEWEPGENVDDDELAGDVIAAAMLLVIRDSP